jgi:hypothetical protein
MVSRLADCAPDGMRRVPDAMSTKSKAIATFIAVLAIGVTSWVLLAVVVDTIAGKRHQTKPEVFHDDGRAPHTDWYNDEKRGR